MTLPHHQYDTPSDQVAFEEHEDRKERAAYPTCQFCGRPVEAGRDYRRVYGWVCSTGKDGFRRDGYGDEWAHKVCIEIQRTVGLDQTGLF